MRRSLQDPVVRAAIQHAAEKRARKARRQSIAAALKREGAVSFRELQELTGLDAGECGAALDELRIAEAVVVEDGVFCWARSEVPVSR